jgi:hypothetical protein
MATVAMCLFAAQSVSSVEQRNKSADASARFTWDDVLAIAVSRSRDSKSRLKGIANSDPTRAEVQLARVILRRWNDERATFSADVPLPVRTDWPIEQVNALAPNSAPDAVTLKLEVDRRGMVTSVVIVAEAVNPKLRPLAREVPKSWLFCPAKKGDHYVAGAVVLVSMLH